jgi:hypothetical protein
MDRGMDESTRYAAMSSPAGGQQERLVVRDEKNLHVIARFMRALLLNQLREPSKVKVMEKLHLAVAMDLPGHEESALTVTFDGGRVILECGIAPDPDIVLRCEAAMLMKLARVPAGPAALKFLATPEGRELIKKFRTGELRIKGIASHPLGMMKFADFLAPSDG